MLDNLVKSSQRMKLDQNEGETVTDTDEDDIIIFDLGDDQDAAEDTEKKQDTASENISNLFFMNHDPDSQINDHDEKSVAIDNSKKKDLDSIFFGLSEYEEAYAETVDASQQPEESAAITDETADSADSLNETENTNYFEKQTVINSEETEEKNLSETDVETGSIKEQDTNAVADTNVVAEANASIASAEASESLVLEEDLSESSLEQSVPVDSINVKAMTFLLTLGLALLLVYLVHGTLVRQMIWSDFVHTTIYVWLGMKVLLLVDAGILFASYRKKSLLLSALLCGAVYLVLRRKVRQRSVKLVYVWIAVNLVFTIGMIGNFNRFMGKIQLYDRQYSSVMLQFELNKTQKQADGHCVDSVIGRHMKRYTYEVIGVDENGLLEVRVAGDANTAITDVVVPDHNISPNTELYFKVKRNGEYYLTGLIINGSLYNAFTDTVWEYWCTKK